MCIRDKAGLPDHLLRRRGGRLRLDGPGQPENLPLGEGEPGAHRVSLLSDRHPQAHAGPAEGLSEGASGRQKYHRLRAVPGREPLRGYRQQRPR